MNLILAAAAVAQAFNLSCAGVSTSTIKPVPFAKNFRVDLASGRWCENACKITHPIFAVTDDEIIFQQKADQVLWVKEWVNRGTGEFTSEGGVFSPRTSLEQHGTCTRQPFTGMPEFTRQF